MDEAAHYHSSYIKVIGCHLRFTFNLFFVTFNCISRFDTFFSLCYYICNKDQVLEHLVSTIGLDGLFPSKSYRNKTHLWP